MTSHSTLVSLTRADLLDLPVALLMDACEMAGVHVVDDHSITWSAGNRTGPAAGSSFPSMKEAAVDALQSLSIGVHLAISCNLGTDEDHSPRFMWSEAWSHCFVGAFAETTRWVFSIAENRVVHAQMRRGSEWYVLSPQETAHLSESLTAGNDLPAAAGDFANVGTGPCKPAWAQVSVVV